MYTSKKWYLSGNFFTKLHHIEGVENKLFCITIIIISEKAMTQLRLAFNAQNIKKNLVHNLKMSPPITSFILILECNLTDKIK